MNPIEMLKSITNPKQFVMNNLGVNNNPMVGNLIKMAQNGDTQGVENFARNMFKEQGKDFDKEFANFMSNFKR